MPASSLTVSNLVQLLQSSKKLQKKKFKSKKRLSSPFPFTGKSWQNLSNCKVGSFGREWWNWRWTDRQLTTVSYSLYPNRTAQYIVYLIPVYPSVLPVEFHRRFQRSFSSFSSFALRPCPSTARCFVTPNFRVYSDATLCEYSPCKEEFNQAGN